MFGRKYHVGVGSYRYGFNGQEKSTEINDQLTTALFWEFDSRIGRRWNVDPKPNISFSPYSCFVGNPIFNSDPLGDSLPKNINTTDLSTYKGKEQYMKSLLSNYSVQLVKAAKQCAIENNKPTINCTAAITVGSSVSFRGKILGIGAGLYATAGAELDLIGVRDNQGVLLGTNTSTNEKPRTFLALSANVGGFGFSSDIKRDANTSYYGNKDEGMLFKKGGQLTQTDKLETPFHTIETQSVFDGKSGNLLKSNISHKTPLLNIKAAAIIGVELNVDFNSRNIQTPAMPRNPFQATQDATYSPVTYRPLLK